MTDEKLQKANQMRQALDSLERMISELQELVEKKPKIAYLKVGEYSIPVPPEDAWEYLIQHKLQLELNKGALQKKYDRL